uniref:Uncharacterized protein n=1 Tax=Tanacetum cinerariifolium TaxID=118510 RepID=A0A699H0E8_TANCI|nr:hypothetical protein [Tanacetum cinerariifolium]
MAKTINGEAYLHALVDGKEISITESSIRRDIRLEDKEGIDCLPNSTVFEQLTLLGKPKRKDTQVPQPSDPIKNVPDEAVYKELGDILVRATTTASSLEAEQDMPRNHGGSTAQTRLGVYPNIPMIHARKRVLDLEKTTTTQRNEIASLKRRVKKLEKKNRSRTHRLKRLYKVGLNTRIESFGNEESLGKNASKQERIDAIDAYEEITMVSVQDEVVSNNDNKEMFDVDVLDGEEVFVVEHEVAVKGVNDAVNVVKEVVEFINTAKLIIDAAQDSAAGDIVSTASAATTISAATTTTATITNVGDITLSQALEEIKSTKPKEKGIVIQKLGKFTTTKSSQQSQDKAAFDEEERIAREKAKTVEEANIALIETWDDKQAKIDADHQLVERMQEQEQEELSIIEKATLF